jgi:hypothetical protein
VSCNRVEYNIFFKNTDTPERRAAAVVNCIEYYKFFKNTDTTERRAAAVIN